MVSARAIRWWLWCGLTLVAASLAFPYWGWDGLRTVGPAIGVLAGCVLLAGYRRRCVSVVALGAAVAVLAGALILWRLRNPVTTVSPVLRRLLVQARSPTALDLGLVGAVLLVLAGLGAISLWRRGGVRHRVPALHGEAVLDGDRRVALTVAWRALWTSRVIVWGAGLFGMLRFGVVAAGTGPSLARPFGHLGTLLLSPASAWDASAYLGIAQFGFGAGHADNAFFPLYPTVVRVGAWSPKAAILTGVVVSLLAALVAFYLLHRLVTLECGRRTADLTILVTAFFPLSFFYSAVYTESLFLALTVGAIYAARTDRWLAAGVAGALAAATRPTGLVILCPLLVLYLYGPRPSAPRPTVATSNRWRAALGVRYPARRDLAFLLLVPAGAFAVLALHGSHGDWLSPLHAAQRYWGRRFVPFGAVVDGLRDAVRSVRQIAGGPGSHALPAPPLGEFSQPVKLATADLTDVGFLALAIVTTFGAIRRLPAAYGVYAAVSVAVAASTTSPFEPLASFPRYVMVVFPCQIWLALWAQEHERRRLGLVIASAALLALFASEFASWRWVA
jgi:hypothetical protein